MKTHKGTAKRVKKTASGKYTRESAFKNHLLQHKSASRKRGNAGSLSVSSSDNKNIKRALGK
jgi:large subunit ribosomal protein L35